VITPKALELISAMTGVIGHVAGGRHRQIAHWAGETILSDIRRDLGKRHDAPANSQYKDPRPRGRGAHGGLGPGSNSTDTTSPPDNGQPLSAHIVPSHKGLSPKFRGEDIPAPSKIDLFHRSCRLRFDAEGGRSGFERGPFPHVGRFVGRNKYLKNIDISIVRADSVSASSLFALIRRYSPLRFVPSPTRQNG
jgi:hypothetical protein